MLFFKWFIKSIFYFSFSYIIFSVPVKDRPIFYHLHFMMEPITNQFYQEKVQPAMDKLEGTWKEPLHKSSEAAKKLFSNTLPDNEDDKKAKNIVETSKKEPQHSNEPYTIEERKFLENILKNEKQSKNNH